MILDSSGNVQCDDGLNETAVKCLEDELVDLGFMLFSHVKREAYLVEEENEVYRKGHKQSQHSHVVEVPGKVVLNGRHTSSTLH